MRDLLLRLIRGRDRWRGDQLAVDARYVHDGHDSVQRHAGFQLLVSPQRRGNRAGVRQSCMFQAAQASTSAGTME